MDITAELRRVSESVSLTLQKLPEDSFGRAMTDFASEIAAASEGRIRVEETDPPGDWPYRAALTIVKGEFQNLHFAVLPEERELPAFFQALRFFSDGGTPISQSLRDRVRGLREAAHIQVLVSVHCPNCAAVVEAVAALAAENPRLSCDIVDAQNHPQLAEALGIRAVPATVIDGDLLLTGALSAERLAELLLLRGGPEFEREVCRSLIFGGRTGEAAKRLTEGSCGLHLLQLFQEPDLSTRMGVLLALEKALDVDPAAVRALTPDLIRLLSHPDARIRGDIADLLGRVGDVRAIPHLERLAADPDEDVAEAAADALEQLRPSG